MMNPIGFLTYVFARSVAMSDVDDKFFIGRRIHRRIVYGPGVICVTYNVTIKDSTFHGCDFYVVPDDTLMQAALEMRDTTCTNMRFEKVTFVGTEKFADIIRASSRDSAEKMNIVHVNPVPIPVGID